MMNFKDKRHNLLNAADQLKKEFIGLDKIIDELITNVEPWYLLHEQQTRPSIINLWGMTGVGKTSLIKRLFEILDLVEILYRFDVGKYSSTSSQDLKYELSEDLENISGKPCAFIFDEFQLARTISATGEELDKSNLRIIWDMLDNGIVEVLDTSWQAKSLSTLIFKLEYCLRNGVTVANGKILEGHKTYSTVFADEYSSGAFEQNDEDLEYIPQSYVSIIKDCNKNRWFSKKQIAEEFSEYNLEETVKELEKIFKKAFSVKECNFNKAIIFVIGNLDEAYKIQDVINPDMDADFFSEYCEKITITDIKESLQTRFRSEQIARLGNTHIIYPAFTSEDFKNIIELELSKIIIPNYQVEFQQSIKTFLYQESVFPTQGVRPILTSINSIIKAYIPRILLTAIEKSIPEGTLIKWNFIDSTETKHSIEIQDKHFEFVITSKVEKLRKTKGDQTQLITAVHESGHAITSALIAGILPEYVYSKTAASAEGFCYSKEPDIKGKDYLIAELSVLLGGIVAEELVFKTITLGSNSDLKKTSALALKIIREYGMGTIKANLGYPGVENELHKITNGHETHEEEAQKLIKDAYDLSKKCLYENRKSLIELSKYLTKNSKIEKPKIEEILNEHAKWKIPELIDYNKLFNDFKKI